MKEQKNAICCVKLLSSKQSLANGTFYGAKEFLATVKILRWLCRSLQLELPETENIWVATNFAPSNFQFAHPTLLRSHFHLTKR